MRFPHVIQGSEGDQFGDQVAPLFPVGQKMELPDSRIFRYAEMGNTAGEANHLYQSEVPHANWTNQDVTDRAEAGYAVEIGDETVRFHDGTAPPVKMQEGSIIFEHTDDLGGFYLIKEQRVTASNETMFFLKDGVRIQIAMEDATSNALTLLKNPWMDIIIHDSPPTACPVGVPPSIIAGNDWGWVQSKGICSCMSDDTTVAVVLGNQARPSSDVDGSLTAMDYSETDKANIGPCAWVAELAPDTEFGLFWLFID